MCIKSDFEGIMLKLATYGQREKAFLLSSKCCPQGVVCPCPGAIYMHKSIKIYTRTRCQVSVYRTTGPLVTVLFEFRFTENARCPFADKCTQAHSLEFRFYNSGSQRMGGARLLTSVLRHIRWRNLKNGKKGSSLKDNSYS